MQNNNTGVMVMGDKGARQLVTKTGKVTGARYLFTGELTASEIREAGKKLGLKGDKLKEHVNTALSDATANAQARCAVAVSSLQSAGYIPDYTDIRKKSAVIRFVKPVEVKSKKSVEEQAAEVFGCSVEDLRAAISMVKPGEDKKDDAKK